VPTAVALLSGGLDSGVGLALWLASTDRAVRECVTFDYGQRAAAAECAAASSLAGRFGLPWRRVALPWLADAAVRAGSALVVGGDALPDRVGAAEAGDVDSAAAVWVPARNLVFLSIAAAFAEAGDADTVLAGFNREEAATFPDNSADFVAAFDAVAQLGTGNGVRVAAPTIGMAKAEVVAEARRLGLVETEFFSCYDAGPKPCGKCESCVRSRLAWDL
jgi:7-cyano-7-deazaguanine synthase